MLSSVPHVEPGVLSTSHVARTSQAGFSDGAPKKEKTDATTTVATARRPFRTRRTDHQTDTKSETVHVCAETSA